MNLKRVLIVDDEEDLTWSISKILAKDKDKYILIAVNSAVEALQVLSQLPIELVITDVRMPGMNGLATLREIKQRHPLVEVIMLTGHASIETAVQGMELGAFDYLMKPMDIDELLYKVEDAYQRKSIQEKKLKNLQREQ